MTTTNGKVAITYGTILVMSILVIIAGVATVIFVNNFFVIFNGTTLHRAIGFAPYFLGLLSLSCVFAFFYFYRNIFALLQEYFKK